MPKSPMPRDEYRRRRKQSQAKWNNKNRGKRLAITRNSRLKHDYGIDTNQYNNMLSAQNNLCAICHKLEVATGRRLAIDHDHITNKVRALLCSNCNNGLGRFMDSPELLMKAATYLRYHN